MDKYSFQNCQKLVVFSADLSQVLLCKRKGEQDFDGVYSFIGGKMEITDKTLLTGMKREKEEEIGKECKISVFPMFNHTTLFVKKNGNHMLLPHYLAIFKGGTIVLNDEYSEYKWVRINDIKTFEPKIPNIAQVIATLLRLKEIAHESEFVEL